MGNGLSKEIFAAKSKDECSHCGLLSVRRNDFLKLGGFDEIFINGCEGVDLCLRYNRNGFCNYVVHDSGLHVKETSAGKKAHNDQNSQILLENGEMK